MKLLRNWLILFVTVSVAFAPALSLIVRPAAAASPSHQTDMYKPAHADCHKATQSHKMFAGKTMSAGQSVHPGACCADGASCSAFCFAKCFQILGVVTTAPTMMAFQVPVASVADLTPPIGRAFGPSPPPPRA